jgi:hypothetical protein
LTILALVRKDAEAVAKLLRHVQQGLDAIAKAGGGPDRRTCAGLAQLQVLLGEIGDELRRQVNEFALQAPAAAKVLRRLGYAKAQEGE